MGTRFRVAAPRHPSLPSFLVSIPPRGSIFRPRSTISFSHPRFKPIRQLPPRSRDTPTHPAHSSSLGRPVGIEAVFQSLRRRGCGSEKLILFKELGWRDLRRPRGRIVAVAAGIPGPPLCGPSDVEVKSGCAGSPDLELPMVSSLLRASNLIDRRAGSASSLLISGGRAPPTHRLARHLGLTEVLRSTNPQAKFPGFVRSRDSSGRP